MRALSKVFSWCVDLKDGVVIIADYMITLTISFRSEFGTWTQYDVKARAKKQL